MGLKSYQLTLAAAAKRVSQVYGDAVSVANGIAPANDIPYRQVLLQADGADAFIGMNSDVTSTVYGTKVDSSDLQPVTLGPFDQGPIHLSDIWAAGSGATLHVTGIPF